MFRTQTQYSSVCIAQCCLKVRISKICNFFVWLFNLFNREYFQNFSILECRTKIHCSLTPHENQCSCTMHLFLLLSLFLAPSTIRHVFASPPIILIMHWVSPHALSSESASISSSICSSGVFPGGHATHHRTGKLGSHEASVTALIDESQNRKERDRVLFIRTEGWLDWNVVVHPPPVHQRGPTHPQWQSPPWLAPWYSPPLMGSQSSTSLWSTITLILLDLQDKMGIHGWPSPGSVNCHFPQKVRFCNVCVSCRYCVCQISWDLLWFGLKAWLQNVAKSWDKKSEEEGVVHGQKHLLKKHFSAGASGLSPAIHTRPTRGWTGKMGIFLSILNSIEPLTAD